MPRESKSRQVNKALSEDEMNLLGQIKAIVSQMESSAMGGGDDMMMLESKEMVDDDNMMNKRYDEDMMKGEYEDNEDKEMQKSTVAKEAEETASDDAEDRIEGAQPEESDEAMRMIGKQLNENSRTIAQLLGIVKSLAAQVKENQAVTKSQTDAIEQMIEGIGVTQDIMKQAEAQAVAVTKSGQQPIQYQNNDVVKSLAELLKPHINGDGKQVAKSEEVPTGKEGIGQVMTSLVGGN